jgi:hypothetical protein
MTLHVAGILFSSGLLRTAWFQGLAAFVAINTVVYASLSLLKLLPHRRS